MEGASMRNEVDEDEDYISRVATLFLIDASLQMHSPINDDVENGSAFISALKCAHNMQCVKILTSDCDSIGVVIFGTGKKSSAAEYAAHRNCCVLQDLQTPERETILEIEEIWKEDNIMDLKRAASDIVLADALWLCGAILSKHVVKDVHRQILLFTCTDKPHEDQELRAQAERRAADLNDSNIEIHLLPIGNSFDINKFYKNLLKVELGINTIHTTSDSVEELVSRSLRKVYWKRCSAYLTFSLGGNLKMAVGVYNLFREAPHPKRIKLDRRTNEPVVSQTMKIDANSGDIILPSEVSKFTVVGSKKIEFTTEDQKSLKEVFPKQITLLGFRPIIKLKFHQFLRTANFIYPQEDLIHGSQVLFAALLERCHARRVAAVCSLKMNAAANPRLVALLPQIKGKDDCDWSSGYGFHIIYLPYCSEIRHLDYTSLVGRSVDDEEPSSSSASSSSKEIWRADEAQTGVARNIIKKMSMRNVYNPGLFEDPALHTIWNSLEAMALDRNNVETVEDSTKPDAAYIDRRIAGLADDFNKIFPIGYADQSPEKKKTSKPPRDLDIEEMARQGTIMKATVAELKQYLSSQGVSELQLRKDELINRVMRHLKLND